LLVIKLAESRRVAGEPRQEIVAHLGSLRLDVAELPPDDPRGALWRAGFWESVGARLDALANRLSPEQRAAAEAAIARRLPRPEPELLALAEVEADRAERLTARLDALLSLRRRRPFTREHWLNPKLHGRIAADLRLLLGMRPRRDVARTIDGIADRHRVGPSTVRRVAREVGLLLPGERPGSKSLEDLELNLELGYLD
jgi:hypothetical protein